MSCMMCGFIYEDNNYCNVSVDVKRKSHIQDTVPCYGLQIMTLTLFTLIPLGFSYTCRCFSFATWMWCVVSLADAPYKRPESVTEKDGTQWIHLVMAYSLPCCLLLLSVSHTLCACLFSASRYSGQ